MVCRRSSPIREGLVWPGYRCDIEILEVYDSVRGRIKVMFDGGGSDTFNVSDNTLYNFPNAPYPFSLLVVSVMYSQTYNYGYITFETCDLEEDDTPPTDLLGIVVWIKDKIFELLPKWTQLFPDVDYIKRLIESIRAVNFKIETKIEDIGDFLEDTINGLHTLIDLRLGEIHDSLYLSLSQVESRIIAAIENINVTVPDLSLEPVILAINEAKGDIADFVIERVWAYIEAQLFEEDEV